MKKVVLTFLFSSTLVAFGQGPTQVGQLFWNNSPVSLITEVRPDNSVIPLPANVGGANPFLFGLFMAPAGTPAPLSSPLDPSAGAHDPNWQSVFGYTGNSTSAAGAGRLQNPGLTDTTGYTVATTVNVLVRGWSANMGNTWGDVLSFIDAPSASSYVYGTSQMVTLVLGNNDTAIPPPFLFASGGPLTGVTLYVVPEPAAFTLAILGSFAWLASRRRSPPAPRS